MKFAVGDIIKKTYGKDSYVIFKIIGLDKGEFCSAKLLNSLDGILSEKIISLRIINTSFELKKLTKKEAFLEMI